jgi:acetyl-CoA carboxylase / biotin carboxylase 1
MEAKGCAKPMVWKDARRRFYWAVRAKVAWSTALAQLGNASPESSIEYRAGLLESLSEVNASTDRQLAAEKLESLDLTATTAQLKADHLMRRMLELAQEDRKATIGGLVRLVDNLDDDEKNTLISALQNSTRSPGQYFSDLNMYSLYN